MLACSCQPPCATRSSAAPRGECISRVGRTKFWTNSGAHYSKSSVVLLNRLTTCWLNSTGTSPTPEAEAIVTFNLRHFPDSALDTWNIEVQHPDEFLVHLYHLNPDLVVNILHEQAAFIGKSLAQLLAVLKPGVPNFTQLISDSRGVKETE